MEYYKLKATPPLELIELALLIIVATELAVSSVAKRTRNRCGSTGVRIPGWSNQHKVAQGSSPLPRFFEAV